MRSLLAFLLLLPAASWGAAATFVDSDYASEGANTNNLTLTLTGEAADDYGVVCGWIAGTGTASVGLTTATGWTQQITDNVNGSADGVLSCWTKLLTSGSETNPVITVDEAQPHQAFSIIIRGLDTAAPLDEIDPRINDDDATPPHDSVITTNDTATVIVAFFADGTGITAVAPPTGYTEAQENVVNNRFHGLGYDLDAGTAGTISPGSWTNSGTDAGVDGHTITVALNVGASTTVTYDADNYALGATATATATGFGSALTTITEQAGSDAITAEAGATSSSADFVLCSLSDLTPAGACNNTELGISLTWQVTDGTDTADDTFTIDFPATANDFSGDVTCIAGTDCPGDAHDAWASPVTSAATADDFYCRFTSGSGIVNGSGVVMLDGPTGTVECRIFDDSAGAWLAAVSQEFTAPAAGQGSDDNCAINEPVLNTIKEAIRNAVCQ